MSLRLLTDDALQAQCREDRYRASGPGGQKRNKTSSAVRLVHLPTGVHVQASDDRSLRVNQVHARRHLRVRLAAECREAVDLATFEPPDWFVGIRRGGRIDASIHHPLYAASGGLVLDLLHALGGNPAAVGANLGLSTTAVVRFLQRERDWWTAAQAIRTANGLPALTARD